MFKPIFDKLLVKRAEEMSMTEGGIIIPETFKEKPMQGEIVSVGNDVKAVKPGDIVLHAKWAGTDIMLDSGDYLILSEKDILGVIVPDKKRKRK